MSNTLTIQVRFDHRDADTKEEKDKQMLTAAKMAAKHIYTTALLLQDKSKPQVALFTEDMFTPQEEILLADDIPEEQPAEDQGTG
ncbi:MAG TPA: hypothetical protein VKT73_15345 [Xanthobacteraceae bacterium]|nr:hypothetical protein [Xanthobacteraceae bacterium]